MVLPRRVTTSARTDCAKHVARIGRFRETGNTVRMPKPLRTVALARETRLYG